VTDLYFGVACQDLPNRVAGGFYPGAPTSPRANGVRANASERCQVLQSRMRDCKTHPQPHPNPGEIFLMFLKVKSDDGDILEARIVEFLPLTYADLLRCIKEKGQRRTLHISARSDGHTLNDQRSENSAEINSTVEFHHWVSMYALVENGWLPPPFTKSKFYMVDRNVVSTLREVNAGSARDDHVATDWWFRFLDSRETVLHPGLYALEGCKRATPSYSEFVHSYKDAVQVISRSLPGVTVISYTDEHYKAGYSLIAELGDKLSRETDFLMGVVPLIANRVATKKLNTTLEKILSIAKTCGVSASFCVLAVLSCLYESEKESTYPVGRKILKNPRHSYGPHDAYNALNDLRAIELVVESRKAINKELVLCTCDQALALLWCGISPHLHTYEDRKSTVHFQFSETIFPRLPEESIDELRSKLADLG